jgi:hypothetical protein
MPVLAKYHGVVIRFIYDRELGTRLHASYGDLELVVALKPLRVIQGDVPDWVRESVLNWARAHYGEFPSNPRDWRFAAPRLAAASAPQAQAR